MRLLLDTHVFVWLLTENRKATRVLKKQIELADEVFVSSASVWEVAIKHAVGKIEGDPLRFHQAIGEFGFRELQINGVHARTSAKLPTIHRDPFDRLLVAQAICERLNLLTADDILSGYSELVLVV